MDTLLSKWKNIGTPNNFYIKCENKKIEVIIPDDDICILYYKDNEKIEVSCILDIIEKEFADCDYILLNV